jgi:hypothetical protein
MKCLAHLIAAADSQERIIPAKIVLEVEGVTVATLDVMPDNLVKMLRGEPVNVDFVVWGINESNNSR